MALENVEDLSKQLLLVQVVKLEGGVHSVDDGVLVDKSGKLLHDLGDQALGVAEVVHDVAARNDMVLLVHAVVESGDVVDVVNVMDHNLVHLGLAADILFDALLRSCFYASLFGYFGL